VHQVARELSQAGWRLKAVSTDNGSEFRSQEFRQAVAKTGAQLRFIHAGRPQSNGCVERVQRTVLEECWRPSFARSMIPKYTALRRDLVQYLRFYNFDRAHTGRHTAVGGRRLPSPSRRSPSRSFGTICSGVCFRAFIRVPPGPSGPLRNSHIPWISSRGSGHTHFANFYNF
jgi:transposase InsO family protein